MGKRGPVAGQRDGRAAGGQGDAPARTPRDMPAEVKSIYRRLVRVLELGAADESLAEGMAQAVWLQRQAVAAIARDGLLVLDTTHGNGQDLRRHPALLAWRSAYEVARASAMRLGGSPLDRQRLPEPEKENALAAVLWGDE